MNECPTRVRTGVPPFSRTIDTSAFTVQLNVDEYYRMAEVGILREGDRDNAKRSALASQLARKAAAEARELVVNLGRRGACGGKVGDAQARVGAQQLTPKPPLERGRFLCYDNRVLGYGALAHLARAPH